MESRWEVSRLKYTTLAAKRFWQNRQEDINLLSATAGELFECV